MVQTLWTGEQRGWRCESHSVCGQRAHSWHSG